MKRLDIVWEDVTCYWVVTEWTEALTSGQREALRMFDNTALRHDTLDNEHNLVEMLCRMSVYICAYIVIGKNPDVITPMGDVCERNEYT